MGFRPTLPRFWRGGGAENRGLKVYNQKFHKLVYESWSDSDNYAEEPEEEDNQRINSARTRSGRSVRARIVLDL